MESQFLVRIKRNVAIILFLIFDILQIYVVGHIVVEPHENNILRFAFQWSPSFTLKPLTIAAFILLPFILSYFTVFSNIAGNRRIVQIIGPQSLIQRVKMEFHKGNPEGKEFTMENIHHLLEDMAKGEPQGTIENLEMLFSIGTMVENLLNKSNVNSVKRVYVSDDLTPNAFTLRVIPLPFIGQDWIIINRNIVDVLDQDEIRAVVAHEIGHAARKDSWINSLLYSPRLVIILAWSVLLAAMTSILLVTPFGLDAILRIVSIIMLVVIIRFFMNFGLRLTTYAYRKTELLADYYGAKLVGSEILINALIKIGQRGEVFRAVQTELMWLMDQFQEVNEHMISRQIIGYLDPGETSAEQARETTIRFFVAQKLAQTFNGLRLKISQEEMDQFITQAYENLAKERGYQVESEGEMLRLGPMRSEQMTKDWRSVDLDEDEKLDREEITQLVKELVESNKRLFETEALEQMGIVPSEQSHPQVSDRITFLYYNLLKKE